MLDNHHSFQNLVRTYPGTKLISNGHVALLKRFSWKRVAIVYDHHESDGIFNKVRFLCYYSMKKIAMFLFYLLITSSPKFFYDSI